MKVVLADDDRVVVQMITAGLKKRGIQTIPAFDAMQAVMATMRSEPDAVIMDLNMPGGTGIEAVRRIKGSSKTSVIPIVAITGSATEEARQNALDLGAAGCLEKPVDVDALADLLEGLTGAEPGS
jgi:CheY-like chemotaxis protein